jgi:hypothetical protein
MSYYLLDNEDYTLGIKNNKSENHKYMCTSKMSDGRFITDYRPKCIVNRDLNESLVKNNIKNSSYESRVYIQNNGNDLVEDQFTKSFERLAECVPCKIPFTENGTMAPEKYVIRCDNVSCSKKEVDPNGIGDGRNYL